MPIVKSIVPHMVCFTGRRVFKCFDFQHERHCVLKKVFFNIISNFFLKVKFSGDKHLLGSARAYGLIFRSATFVSTHGLCARRRPAPLALHLSAYGVPYGGGRRGGADEEKVTKGYKIVTKWLHFGNKKKTKNFEKFLLTFFLNCDILEFRAYCRRPGASGPSRYRALTCVKFSHKKSEAHQSFTI